MARTPKECVNAVEQLKSLILSGSLESGARLPTESRLVEMLGVSRTTVRKALSQLSDEGYVTARFGKGSYVNADVPRTQVTVPFITSYADNSSRFFDLYSGIQDFFNTVRYTPRLIIANRNAEAERSNVYELYCRGCKNVIILSTYANENADFYNSMLLKGLTPVFVDQKSRDVVCDFVSSNNLLGGYMAAKTLLKTDSKDIIYFADDLLLSENSKERLKGCRMALRESKLAMREDLIFEARLISAERFVETLSVMKLERPAIFCCNDDYAIRITNLLQSKGMNIPLIGFDNLPQTQTNHPSISTVEQNYYRFGFLAAKMIHERILDPARPCCQYYLPVNVIERTTTSQGFYGNGRK